MTKEKSTYWYEQSVAKKLREYSETVRGVLVRMDIKEGAAVIERLVKELQKRDNAD